MKLLNYIDIISCLGFRGKKFRACKFIDISYECILYLKVEFVYFKERKIITTGVARPSEIVRGFQKRMVIF